MYLEKKLIMLPLRYVSVDKIAVLPVKGRDCVFRRTWLVCESGLVDECDN